MSKGRDRLVNRELNPLLSTLPAQFKTIFDHQVKAVVEIVEAFDQGAKVVVLDAPTGSGKTLIAECVRRELQTRAVYVCHNKELQAQFARDFDYARVLMGRSNYLPEHSAAFGGATCEDCNFSPSRACSLCVTRESCPYVQAREAAIRCPVPVLNSAYWLSETHSPKSRFAGTGLVVLDECDTLEGVLMGQVEVFVSERRQAKHGIVPPARMTKEDAFVGWGENVLELLTPEVESLERSDSLDVRSNRELRVLQGLVGTVGQMVESVRAGEPWVYTGGAGSDKRKGSEISFRPVKVSRFGAERIWGHDKRFLLMSGTVVSPGMLLDGLGWDGDYVAVSMESQFHAKNRQVVVRPVADMTRKGATDAGFRSLERAVEQVLDGHRGERVLVHSVSYNLANRITSVCERSGRDVFTYGVAASRSASIAKFRGTAGSVLVAPSADRGVDLPGDLCRAIIILKVPYLSLGDRQTKERLWNTPDGAVWYNVQVARTLMQMVGRGVRSVDDFCTTYVLDKQFVKWRREWGHLLPAWFRKGIRVEVS